MIKTNELIAPVKPEFEGEELEAGHEDQKQASIAALKSQFKDLNPFAQDGVKQLLRRLRMRNYGPETLESAINDVGRELYENEYWTGGAQADKRENRAESLSLLGNQENGLVGRELTVEEVMGVLEEM